MASCNICTLAVDLDDPTLWREITGWVHGPKRDSLTLRKDTGAVAHEECIAKVKSGQAPDQPDMFDKEVAKSVAREEVLHARSLYGEDLPF